MEGDWRKAVFILTIVQFFMRLAITSIKPFIPLYLPELGVTVPELVAFWTGVATSANFIAQIFTQPFWGSLSDRYGYKTMVIRSVFSVGFFNLAITWASTINELVLFRFLMGIMSGFTAASTTYVAVNSPKEKLGYSVGLLQSGLMAGTILGPGVGGILAEFFGYRFTFVFSGLLSLTMVPLIIFGIKEDTRYQKKGIFNDIYLALKDKIKNKVLILPQKKNEAYYNNNSVKRVISYFYCVKLSKIYGLLRFSKKIFPQVQYSNNKIILTSLIMIICAQFGTQSSDAFLAIYIKEIYTGDGLNLLVALSFGLSAMASLVAAPVFGILGDRFGHKRILHFSLIGMTVTVGLQAFCSNVLQLIILRILSGLFAAGVLPNANAILGNLAGESGRGHLFGIAGSATALGNLSGPLFGGIIAASFNLRTVFWMTALVLMIIEALTIIYGKKNISISNASNG